MDRPSETAPVLRRRRTGGGDRHFFRPHGKPRLYLLRCRKYFRSALLATFLKANAAGDNGLFLRYTMPWATRSHGG